MVKNIITYSRPGKEPITFTYGSLKPMKESDALRVIRQNGNNYSDIKIIKITHKWVDFSR